MKDYHKLYNLSDILLLADIFENFRSICMNHYAMDPAWYFGAPGLAWDAALKITKVQLELLSDPDMLLMIESGIRGGIATISHRHAKANNEYMGTEFDTTKECKKKISRSQKKPRIWMLITLVVGNVKTTSNVWI